MVKSTLTGTGRGGTAAATEQHEQRAEEPGLWSRSRRLGLDSRDGSSPGSSPGVAAPVFKHQIICQSSAH